MIREEQETGRKILVEDQDGNRFELIEFQDFLEEEGFEIEERLILRTPGGREVRPVPGEKGKYVEEGSGKTLHRLKVIEPQES